MRIICSVPLTTGALAFALTFGAVPPAEAGKACNRIGLSSPCIKSNDLKAQLHLSEPGKDGRLLVRSDVFDTTAVRLDGRFGNVTNLFSNDQNEGNGLVKAWAQINADGTIFACWRCNTDPNETQRITTGQYEVDFTPLATALDGRPRSATIDVRQAPGTTFSTIQLADRVGDSSSVFVNTQGATGTDADRPFVLLIF